jgi:UDP-N-acetylglucosamine--N-acetylmuramyl-(pentapeptide) pyrophosphoryl-undecaprenol N-acetylglucosamine transferase
VTTLTASRVAIPRLLLAGGGTGGHVYPALAVLDEVEGDRLWVGSVGGREEPLVRRAGLEFRGVPTGAVLGRGPVALANSALRNVRGILSARSVLASYRPSVVLATGGYVSVPVVVAARTLGIPSAIYLPDVEPGLAVKVLARFADRVACSTEATRRYLPPGKVVPTGYPVRPELRAWAERADGRRAGRALLAFDERRPILMIMGGSQGARSINRALHAALPRLLPIADVLHVCGPNEVGEARAAHARLPSDLQPRYQYHPYLHDEMGAAFAAADLVVARAGASVLGELPAFGLPGVLIPGTFAGGHQRHNADFLADAGAAVRLDDQQLGQANVLADTVTGLLNDPARRDSMRAAARSLDRPDAALQVARLLAQLAEGRIR